MLIELSESLSRTSHSRLLNSAIPSASLKAGAMIETVTSVLAPMDVGSFTMGKIPSGRPQRYKLFALRNDTGCPGLTQAPEIGKSIHLARLRAIRPKANLTYHELLPPSRALRGVVSVCSGARPHPETFSVMRRGGAQGNQLLYKCNFCAMLGNTNFSRV
jgi:hypothetical protein